MVKLLRALFITTKDIGRAGYLWNGISSLLVAMQSAVVLMVITRTNDIKDAGVFSISYAIASLMLYIGEFGVRRFQVSDLEEVYKFEDYFSARIISCVAMALSSIAYIGYGFVLENYSGEKCIVIALMCTIKLIDAFADVFYGRFQQKWRLDVAAKTTSFRIFLSTGVCIISLFITHDLITSMFIWLVFSIIAMCTSTLPTATYFCKIKIHFRYKIIKQILIECFPLFLGNFLLLYIGNAPKYAIDVYMNEEMQAYFNFIFMPVFTIGLLANFIFNPVLTRLAKKWADCEFKGFFKIVIKQTIYICVITILAVAFAYILGIHILSFIFGVKLGTYKMELCILLIGGGMLALVNFCAVVLTVIRQQKLLVWGYVIVSFLAKLLSDYFVNNYQIIGAAVFYTFLMGLLAICFICILSITAKREAISRKRGERK